MVQLFGFKIGKAEENEQKDSIKSFAPPPNDDGAAIVSEGGMWGTSIDLEGTISNEVALISKYREMATQSECDKAIDDVVNETVIGDEGRDVVSIKLDGVDLPDNIKTTISEEFTEILKLLKFQTNAYNILKNWYVDGRIYYHIMIDTKQPKAGIQELRFIDPRRIRKIREEISSKETAQGMYQINKKYNTYFLYKPSGAQMNSDGIKIAQDSIAYVNSGLFDAKNSTVLSHLHKAIKPLNQLSMLEDSTVIYRIARAPERRIFYIDIGNLPKGKAEQYMRDMMIKHKNRLVYDVATGDIRDDRKFMTMMEDYWLPRREGGRSTEITTLPGGQNLGELDDVIYFRKKLYESLNVPVSRLEVDAQFNLGRSSEITRDEVKFSKFISRLRTKFNELFYVLLERQLLLKGVMTHKEWQEYSRDIYFDYLEDNHFAEIKEAEIMENRLRILADADQYDGKYFSKKWIRENVLHMSEEEIKQIEQDFVDDPPPDPEDFGDDDGEGPLPKKSGNKVSDDEDDEDDEGKPPNGVDGDGTADF